MIRFFLSLFLLAPVVAAAFVPLGTGPLGEINARDGDRAFNAVYFANAVLAGAPVVTRLEAQVGAEGEPPAVGEDGFSARWTGTLTPAVSGVFPIRVSGPLSLRVDGRLLASGPETSTGVVTARLPMKQGRPYEIVIESSGLARGTRVAVEWGEPVPLPAEAATEEPDEARAGPPAGATVGVVVAMENRTYRAESRSDGSLVLTEKRSGAQAVFAPEFAVIHQPPGRETKMDPKGGKYLDEGAVGNTNYVVPSWEKETDYLVAARPRTRLRASASRGEGSHLVWEFPAQPGYTLHADLHLPTDGGEPVLRFELTPKVSGQFSVGYVGAAAQPMREADWVWQPLVWQDRRFPNRSYLTKEFQCPIPFVMAGAGGVAVGVGADAAEMPYRMPTISDSRFGVLVRNAAGEAQPMLFAPILGGPESRRKAGEAYSFRLRLVVRQGAWFDAYAHLAHSLYQFGDIRENVGVSLNTTIENMTDYFLRDEFAYWYPRYKTWGYQNDGGPGAGRQQSAADAISLALVFDRKDVFEERARPTLEYALSRKSNSTKFDAADFMGGFVNYPIDLVAAYRLTGGRTTALREKLEPAIRRPISAATPILTERDGLELNLAWYRLTRDKAFLERAVTSGDRYVAARVAKPAADFGDVRSSFWTELAPGYDLLYELYRASGERRFLMAAAAALRTFSGYTYLVPVTPAGSFTANPGGSYNGQPVPEEVVPAWQVSANGLAAECAGTAHSHRGVFMTSYAGYMVRIGAEASEPLFTDIARNAVVGRYANYPSYAYRNGYTTVHQKADYPLRSFEEIKKFTSAHYNHPLPMTAFLVDFLVGDFAARSGGQIDFEADFTDTGAYFRNRLYGAHAGRFLGDAGVYLWLAKGLLSVDSPQLNHLTARGNGKFYVAFANQSARPVTASFSVDSRRARVAGLRRATVWQDGRPAGTVEVRDGRATVSVTGKGLTALIVPEVDTVTEIQEAALDPLTPPLPEGSTVTVKAAFGPVTATALRFGRGLTSVHVWLKAGPGEVKSAKLRATASGQTIEAVCDRYPFEFTVPVEDNAADFRFTVEAETTSGAAASPEGRVRLKAGGP